MSEDVKRAGPRRYDSSRRQARAQESRAAVLRAALDRFLQHGYSSTTIAQVADDASVSVETVYKTFGNKAGLLKAVFDVAVAGDDEPVPMAERDDIQRVIAEPDAARKLALYFDHVVDAMPRTAPVQLLVRDAAATNDDADAVWQQLRREQLEAMTQFAARPRRHGPAAGTGDDGPRPAVDLPLAGALRAARARTRLVPEALPSVPARRAGCRPAQGVTGGSTASTSARTSRSSNGEFVMSRE